MSREGDTLARRGRRWWRRNETAVFIWLAIAALVLLIAALGALGWAAVRQALSR